MREIIFRGKRIDNGEWVEGSLISKLDVDAGSVSTCEIIERTSYAISADYDTLFHHITPALVDERTVGQYTGLEDKNGRRIFEGDIISAVLTGGNYKDFRWPNKRVVFHAGCFTLYDGRHEYIPLASYAPTVAFEVIGNIDDNPELLEEGEK